MKPWCLLLACLQVVAAGSVAGSRSRRRSPPPPPPPPQPAHTFDGVVRPCPSDALRHDAYMVPPPCPARVKECRASSNHCASLAKLPTGGLGLSWFSGYREGWAYTGVGLALLPSLNSTVWEPLGVRNAESPGIPGIAGFSRQNPVLFADSNLSELLVFGVQQPSRSKVDRASVGATADPVPNQESLGTMWVARSSDWGRTFAAVEPFDPYHGSWGRNSLLLGLDGSWLMPVYNESGKTKGHQFEHSAILRKPAGVPVLPLSGWALAPMDDTSFLVQPSVIRLKPGQPKLRVYYRDRRAEWIYTATSPDDGLTWSTPVATALPNNNAGIHASVLQSGTVAIAYNNMSGDPGHDLRNVLAVSLSDDGGETFAATRLLENHPPTNAVAAAGARGVGAGGRTRDVLQVDGIGPTSCDCYSYPTMEQTADGAIYVAYTYQRRTIKVSRISEAWVRATDGPLCQ